MRRCQSRRQSCCQLVDSSLDESELTNSETKYHSGLETELTDVDDNIDEVIKDVKGLINYTDLLANKVHLLEFYLK